MIEYFYTILGREEEEEETWYASSGTIVANNIQEATILASNNFKNVERVFVNEIESFKYSDISMTELYDFFLKRGL